ARYRDLMALAAGQPAKVIGAQAILRDRPGFEVELLTRGSIPETAYATPRHEVLMPIKGYWRLTWEGGTTVLNPGDTCAVPRGVAHALYPSMSGEASLYRIRATDDPAGATGRLL
ncbi:MAG: cupin, partial [Paracoccaceae bacterium]|nr:cupin [Paracoccaceae bacterium]